MTRNSVVRLHRVVTIPRSLIRSRLGTVGPAVQQEIRRRFFRLFEGE